MIKILVKSKGRKSFYCAEIINPRLHNYSDIAPTIFKYTWGFGVNYQVKVITVL